MNLEGCIKHLADGGVVAYPTETIWGLGVDAFNKEALEKLFALKGREQTKAVSILVRDVNHAKEFVEISPSLEKALDSFWPGALTAVLPALDADFASSLGGEGYIGLRCSSHSDLTSLVWSFDNPIVTTSANRSGDVEAKSIDDLGWLPAEVLAFKAEGAVGGTSSTVVKVDGDKVELLREGSIPWSFAKTVFAPFLG